MTDKPSSDICQQGYMAYLIFNNVVVLTVNQRVSGTHSEQTSFRNLLARLQNGQSNVSDWKALLDRQPASVKNLNEFNTAANLFYSNRQVAKHNYEQLTQLNQPIAVINARHSSNKVKQVSPLNKCLGFNHVFSFAKVLKSC